MQVVEGHRKGGGIKAVSNIRTIHSTEDDCRKINPPPEPYKTPSQKFRAQRNQVKKE
jgi:hypothetical protein